MKLYATPLSHFSRKVRILLDLYSIKYDLLDIGNVADKDSKHFANNPLMRIPVLVDDPTWIVESDHIAQYLVQTHDPKDRFKVQIKDVPDLNLRAVMNGIMNEEVKIIIARRSKIPTEQFPFFDKALQSISQGLAWLESQHTRFNVTMPGYREFHLVCLWDHVDYYGLVPMNYDKLKAIVADVSRIQQVQQSAPKLQKKKI